MAEPLHLTGAELNAGLDEVRRSPQDQGTLEMIVRRPQVDKREVLEQAKLDIEEGLIGDNWKTRGCPKTPDGNAHPDMQLNIMNARVIALLAQNRERWKLAGDQLVIDMDLSADNFPAGTQLAIGSAIIEITPEPHNGCKKFMARYGSDALKFVNSPLGKQLHLRGVNAKVVRSGLIQRGDIVSKVL